MALGGRAAEAVIFNKVSTGAQDDLQKVLNSSPFVIPLLAGR